MVGHKSGVAAFLKEANSDIYIQGCPCHLMHLTAEKASKELLLNVEEFLIDILLSGQICKEKTGIAGISNFMWIRKQEDIKACQYQMAFLGTECKELVS
ncbi:hypothetical protein HOLleu_10581 [Holothuria leucospilota]|uniref:Uncharacterized protein n=1 Tax=Holothuria leucospilota TaxID=206669 RepID=A0A9Q1HBT4_HOLLE|nr:hypothetical protein HOLleu_10581 [Holothuria leucospilota]